jgi:phosphatidylserine/phosphatidylglycerophosphate/cardiolipin synthase-like enzyme
VSFELPQAEAAARGEAELVIGADHLQRVIRDGILAAKVSLDLATADLKAARVPDGQGQSRSILELLRERAERGIEVRILHAGVPSGPALQELRGGLPETLHIRRCPRVHAKVVIVDSRAMYMGSANLTGAGLGAKAANRRNFEMGIWSESPNLIDAAADEFNAIWEGTWCDNCGRRDVCPVPLEEPELP